MPKTKKIEITSREPVNVEGLLTLAKLKSAGRCMWPGSEVTVRTVLLAYVDRVGADGWVKTSWFESGLAGVEFKTRRYSCEGPGVEGKSLFCLPKLLRDSGRQGLWNAFDVDIENCHFNAQVARHPGRPILKEYLKDKANWRQQVVEATGVKPADAKQLFLKIAYGGNYLTWCEEFGVSHERLPCYVVSFAHEQGQIRAKDVEDNLELLKVIKSAGGERNNDATLESYVNMKWEREAINELEGVIKRVGVVCSWECDGLFVANADIDPKDEKAGLEWRCRVMDLIRARTRIPVAIKEPASMGEILTELRKKFPGEDWLEIEGEDVMQQEALVAEVLRLDSKSNLHRLYAKIVALEPQAFETYPYAVSDLWKYQGDGRYLYWCAIAQEWCADGGRDMLLDVISDCLTKRIRGWRLELRGMVGEMDAVAVLNDAPAQFNGVQLIESCEKLLRSQLRDREFGLDGRDARRYVVFSNGVFDRETGKLGEKRPEIRSSHCTNWALGDRPDWMVDFYKALANVDSDGATLSKDTCKVLAEFAKVIPSLWFFYDVTGCWDRAIYVLKHVTRAVFALEYNEILVIFGAGAQGEDTVNNLISTLLGSYFANLPCTALTDMRDLEAPSPGILGLRGKRYVCIRELAKGGSGIKGHVLKGLCDPKGVIRARALYSNTAIEFAPHFLIALCSNASLQLEDCGGLARRTKVVKFPFNFVMTPEAPNEKQRDPSIENQFIGWRNDLFWMLYAIYEKLMKNYNLDNVLPVPQEVTEDVDEELQEEWMTRLDAFKMERLMPASDVKLATNIGEVRSAFFEYCGGEIGKKDVQFKLSRRGFAETRIAYWESATKRVQRRVYTVKLDGSDCLVQLRGGA